MKKQVEKYGFELLETREIKEISATAYYYEHKKSGAHFLNVKCEDNNKVFCVTFKTVPQDNTGCPHIMEHSVLNGSKNFPAKSTFMELIKGSLHTFINAMTDSDMTLYPVASTNEKDFYNLSRVYMDAVFFPKIYEQPHILRQEGWHYDIKDPEDELKIIGVVYNEMKGAYSSPDNLIELNNQIVQFPDSPYKYDSGGNPKEIPQLTYEAFINFHKKHYHPSNSYIFLYGDADENEIMEMMDKEYLSQFNKDVEPVEVPFQKPFTRTKKLEVEYPVEEGKDISEQYHLSLNFTYGKNPDLITVSAINALMDILMSTPASPLKRAILESGLAHDVRVSLNIGILQPTFSLICKEVKKENIPLLVQLITDELNRLVKEGIDKKLIEAVLNRREFFLREGPSGNFPKGLYYAFNIYHHWIHGGNPIDALAFEDILKELRRGLTEPYYEELIKKSMLKNHHSSQITYVPVPGLANKWEQEIREKLAEEKNKLSEAVLNKLIEETREFQQWQLQQPTPEELARIPFLTLEDINPEAEAYPLEIEKLGTKTILTHPLKTNGIVYLKAYFDLDHSSEEDLPWLSLYTSLMGMVSSKNYDYIDLSNEIYSHTGDLNLKLNIRPSYQDPDIILLKFLLSGKALYHKTEKLIELAKEFAFYPLFDDYDRLKLLIREAKAKLQTRLFYFAESIATNRLFAPSSQLHHFLDLTSGLDYYRFLSNLDKKLEQDIEIIAHKLEQIRDTYFLQNNLLISITAEEEAIKDTINGLNPFLDAISDKVLPPVERYFHPKELNEGIIAPIQVQYCAKGGNFFRKGYSYSGKLRVLTNILNSDYLYRELREKGGAYGTWAGFTLNGYMYFVSYRDPNLERTLEVYDQTPEFLHNFECSKRDMERYIIGDISNLDYPKTPEGKGAQSDDDYITGFTQEDRQQIRDEVLSTRLEDIRQYADMIEEVMSMNHYCVVGNEAKLKAASELFDRLTPLLS